MAKCRQLTVQLEHHQYPIYIGDNLIQDLELLQKQVIAKQVLIVTNTTIAPLYLRTIQNVFSSIQCNVVILADGEAYKNQQALFSIYDALIQNNHHRDTTLIALGGGVIGDLTGFAAATYQRGVRYIQIPTTLLAQVDASVGGKTAINYQQSKNMLGSFYQPHAVIIDVATLRTLPNREFRAGFGEIIKYGLLAGGSVWDEVSTVLTNGLSNVAPETISHLIEQCCKIKVQFIQDDERELGRRALLNLGHTFGHALESCTHYQRWLHGEAVAIGLFCAGLLSYQLGLFSKSNLEKLEWLLNQAQLPSRIPRDIDLDNVFQLLFKDKKIQQGTLRFVLIRQLGDCYLSDEITTEQIRHVLKSAVEG